MATTGITLTSTRRRPAERAIKIALLGCAEAPRVRVEDARLTPARLREGDRLTFACDLVSTGRTPQTWMADFVVHFVKANGKTMTLTATATNEGPIKNPQIMTLTRLD